MGLKDRDYMKRNEQPETQRKKPSSPIKYLGIGMAILGLITITAIMKILPSKKYSYNPVPDTKNEKQQIVKDWKKTITCNGDGSKCKTSYSDQ